LVPARLKDRDGQQWFRAHLLPREEVQIKEGSWDVMGLRATASVDYTITDKFVLEHRTFEYPRLIFLPGDKQQKVTARDLTEFSILGMAAFASGVGSRALAEFLAAAPKTKRVMAEGVQADDQMVQFGIGELEGRLRAARRHYLDLTSQQDHSIAERGPDASLALDILQATHTLTRAQRGT